MSKAQIEIMPCQRCNQVPTFAPFPSEAFVTRFYVICPCNLRIRVPIHLNDTAESIPRRVTLKGAIRYWNTLVKKRLAVSVGSNTEYVTCSFCGKGELTWNRRPYKSPWKASIDYVLYEKIENDLTTINIRGHTIKSSKFVVHSCAKNIKSITYSDN
jgi:hypothetical protein